MSSKKPIYLVNQHEESGKYGRKSPPALGLLYIAQTLIDAGYKVRIFHPRHNRVKAVQDAVRDEEPLFVGFSNFLPHELPYDLETSKWLKTQGVKVVWGGIFSTVQPEVPLGSGFVDYIVVGEGERPVVQLAEAIENGVAPKGIPGVGYCDGEEMIIEPPLPPEPDLDKYGLAWDLLNLEDYIARNEKLNAVMTAVPFSRGCPFRCSFCYNAHDTGRRSWRGHSLEYMKDMVSYLNKRAGVNVLLVV